MSILVTATADAQFGTNSYLVEDLKTHDAVIIDANLDPGAVLRLVTEHHVNMRAIVLTHTDVDHIAGLPELIDALGPLTVALHDAEKEVVVKGKPLRRQLAYNVARVEATDSLVEGIPYRAGSLEFEVLHTPGHSPGGVTLKIGNALFTGDALFAGSIGRSDFHNSDGRLLLDSIKEKLLAEDDEMVVLPGHMQPSTIGRERRTNPFL